MTELYAPAFEKTTGPDKLFNNMVPQIFMQDGAPSHTANLTQQLCSRVFPSFWDKHFWLGNSPDVNAIENLWSIMEETCWWKRSGKRGIIWTSDVTQFFKTYSKERGAGEVDARRLSKTKEGNVPEKRYNWKYTNILHSNLMCFNGPKGYEFSYLHTYCYCYGTNAPPYIDDYVTCEITFYFRWGHSLYTYRAEVAHTSNRDSVSPRR